MAYSTSALAQANFKNMTFGTGTNVSTTDVDQFIVEADALINAYIGMRFSVPVTAGTSALSLLGLLSQSLVVNRVKAIMQVKQETSKDANQNVVSGLLSNTQVMKILCDLRDGNIELAGATLLQSGAGFFNNNNANDVEPTIEKDTKQW